LEGQNTFLGGERFCFYYIFKTNFSGSKKIWGEQKKFRGALPPNATPRVATGLDHILSSSLQNFKDTASVLIII